MAKKTLVIELLDDSSFFLTAPSPLGEFIELRNPGGMWGWMVKSSVASIKIIEDTPNPPPVIPKVFYQVVVDTVNVRPAPSTSYPAKYKLHKPQEVEVVAHMLEDGTVKEDIITGGIYLWVQLKSDNNYMAISQTDGTGILAKKKTN